MPPERLRLYLDQMFQAEVATRLRAQGHDVVRAKEAGQDRADDGEILSQAIAQARILITLDEHFGDWVVLPLSRHPGVIRVKVHPPTPAAVADLLVPFLAQHAVEEFRNRLVILAPNRVRWIETAS